MTTAKAFVVNAGTNNIVAIRLLSCSALPITSSSIRHETTGHPRRLSIDTAVSTYMVDVSRLRVCIENGAVVWV